MRTNRWTDWAAGLVAGTLLTGMLKLNSILAAYTTPMYASWAAHGVGAGLTILLVAASSLRQKQQPPTPTAKQTVWWAYLGGIPGAFAVILAVIAVNNLGLAGAISLMLAGQVLFGMAVDNWELFDSTGSSIEVIDCLAAMCVIVGSTLIITF